MLEMRPTCENCNKPLPNESDEAMICTYECTFCSACVTNVMQNVCPNCGGGFTKRPTRPKAQLERNPTSTKIIYKPIDNNKFKTLLDKNKNISPRER